MPGRQQGWARQPPEARVQLVCRAARSSNAVTVRITDSGAAGRSGKRVAPAAGAAGSRQFKNSCCAMEQEHEKEIRRERTKQGGTEPRGAHMHCSRALGMFAWKMLRYVSNRPRPNPCRSAWLLWLRSWQTRQRYRPGWNQTIKAWTDGRNALEPAWTVPFSQGQELGELSVATAMFLCLSPFLKENGRRYAELLVPTGPPLLHLTC